MRDVTDNNHEAELKRRVDRRMEILDKIGEAQEELKTLKAEDKADGFNEKAMGQMVRELRRGPDYQADQITLEAELSTYRRAVGLPTSLDAAHAAVRAAAESVPEPKPLSSPRRYTPAEEVA